LAEAEAAAAPRQRGGAMQWNSICWYESGGGGDEARSQKAAKRGSLKLI
jgi:hypothetical protein